MKILGKYFSFHKTKNVNVMYEIILKDESHLKGGTAFPVSVYSDLSNKGFVYSTGSKSFLCQ